MYGPRKRVRLRVDLTRYDSRCKEGSLGWTGQAGRWGNMVHYDSGAVLDTLWKSLEVLEDETKAEARRVNAHAFEAVVKDLLRDGITAAELRQWITRLNKQVQKELKRDRRKATGAGGEPGPG